MDQPWGRSRHGTPSGYRRHQILQQDPCDACRAARTAYDARLRATPAGQRRNRQKARAQGRAEGLLRQAHPQEYEQYYRTALHEIETQDAAEVANSA
jgi:hypothetical protein